MPSRKRPGPDQPGPDQPGPAPDSPAPVSEELAEQTAGLVGELAGQERRDRRRFRPPLQRLQRRREQVSSLRPRISALSAAAQAAGQGAQVAGKGARVAGRGARAAAGSTRLGLMWLVDQVLAIAPRLPVRDLTTLRQHYPGRTPDELAEAVIESAARMSASVGAAVGTWAVLPFLPGIPAELTAETLTVVGIEIKLVAELHEVYGMRAPGGVVERMTAYTAAWGSRRGVGLTPAGVVLAVGSPLRRRLQRRLAVRTGESVFSLGPLLTGALASALINRRETRRLGREIQRDLRDRSRQLGQPANWSGSAV